MTSSNKFDDNLKSMRNELKMLWRLSKDVSDICNTKADNLTSLALTELYEELELLADMTDWPRLRTACLRNMQTVNQYRHIDEAVA